MGTLQSGGVLRGASAVRCIATPHRVGINTEADARIFAFRFTVYVQRYWLTVFYEPFVLSGNKPLVVLV